MEEQEDKQPPQRITLAHVEQVNSDFIMALAMQQQEHERAYTMLETIESDSDENENADSNGNDMSDSDEFSQSQHRSRWDFLADDDEFTEDMDVDEDEDDDDDGLDLDELTYEELLALGEFIGEEKRGLSVNEIPSCLHPSKFRTTAKITSGLDRCVICQVEYEEGEELASLSCEHPYHLGCISKWLQIKRVCPICGTEVSSPKASKNA